MQVMHPMGGHVLVWITAIAASVASIGSGTAGVVISEFLASNGGSHLDGDGMSSDWIELWNDSNAEQSLEGWVLTDEPGEEDEGWHFPHVVMAPGARLVVYASGKDVPNYLDSSGAMHTSFKLTASAGGYLALLDSSGRVAYAFDSYPSQREDDSYGLDATGAHAFFPQPTPGGINGTDGVIGFLSAVRLNVSRGFFFEPFVVNINSEDEDTEIRYTTDGSAPSPDQWRPIRG